MRTGFPTPRPRPSPEALSPASPAGEGALTPSGSAALDRAEPSKGSGSRPAPPSARSGFLGAVLGSAGRKALLVGAVAASVLGASLGSFHGPSEAARVGAPVAPVEAPVARSGTEVLRLQDALGKLSAALAPLGISEEQLHAALVGVSASVELTDGHLRRLDESVHIEAKPGARLYASVNEYGVQLSLRPGLNRVVDWGLDSQIDGVSYRFSDGRFSADASGLGPDRMHAEGVAEAIAARFGPLLPAAMREPGYSPRNDPELAANFQQIFDMLRPGGSKASTPTAFSSPRLSLVLRVPSALELPLAEGKYLAEVPKGTRIDIDLSLAGPVQDPKLEVLNLRFSEPVSISAGTERALMKRIDLRGVTVTPGAQISADYALGAEGVVDGLRALIVLTATIAEPRLAGGATHLEPTRLEGARKQVSELIDRELEPALESVIRALAPGVQGVSLERVFGVSPTSAHSELAERVGP